MREKLAELCHDQWSGWMKHMFSKCNVTKKGIVKIPLVYANAIKRQMNTSYENLSENEKNSDRKEADKFLAIFTKEN